MKNFKSIFFILLCILIIFGSYELSAQEKSNQKEKKKKISLRDTTDGAIDLSSYLLDLNGALPIISIITEPAIGYGAGIGLIFFQEQKKKYNVNVSPNITGIVGMLSQNGTWVAGVFHYHVWGPDKIRYLGAAGKPMINIDYYGSGNTYLSENPLELNLNAWALIQRLQFRVAKSNLFIGASYVLFTTDNSIDTIPGKPIVNKILKKLDNRSTLSMLQPIINWDSRNNTFTPTKGINSGLVFIYNASWLGADVNFYKLTPYFIAYQPITSKLFSGWRFNGSFAFGDPPVYTKPFVELRGLPAMKYQNNNTMLVETDWRIKAYKRWSLNAFGGTAKAFENFNKFNDADWLFNYGLGFRYELARAFGMHTGIDFAWSNKGDFAFYLIFGSPWNR